MARPEKPADRDRRHLSVHLALAEVLAEDHDGCLSVVFDDSFAYSDPGRVKILQDMLDLAAYHWLQIIIPDGSRRADAPLIAEMRRYSLGESSEEQPPPDLDSAAIALFRI